MVRDFLLRQHFGRSHDNSLREKRCAVKLMYGGFNCFSVSEYDVNEANISSNFCIERHEGAIPDVMLDYG
jgi:hypothetical protein